MSPAFDLLLLHVGGNDILRARRLAELDEPAERMVLAVRPLARRALWLGPGDLGLAPLFRPPFNWWFTHRTFAAAERFGSLAQRHGIHFIGFHGAPHREVIAADPSRYFGDDGIHPSTECYRYCYRWLIDSAALGFSPAAAPAGPALKPA
jgi:lysophospholipase L1-like esterase